VRRHLPRLGDRLLHELLELLRRVDRALPTMNVTRLE
jgi:hypothetical protein